MRVLIDLYLKIERIKFKNNILILLQYILKFETCKKLNECEYQKNFNFTKAFRILFERVKY